METKANYVLIGLFTLGGILGALGLLLWLAKVEVDRQYAYYDILFEDVSGLGSASDVRYNGLPVGQVVDLDLDEVDSSKVRVRIEVAADTPVNTETVAKLQSQGVTGVSFVGLSGGSETSAALPSNSEIPSERSALQSVFEGAPLVLDRAVELLENVNDVFDPQNREAVATLLENLSSASARIDTVLTDFESLSGDLGSAAREIADFTDRLDTLADTAETTLTTATTTLETTNDTVARIGTFTDEDLVPLADDLRTATQTATRVIEEVGSDASEIAARIDELALRGGTVLESANETLATANQTFTTANEAIEGITSFTDNNLVPLSDDLRTTTQTANRVITEAGGEVQRIAGRIDDLADRGGVALDSAAVALDDAQITIRDARTTVARANTYIDEQLTPLTSDLRTTAQTANRVIDEVGTRANIVADRFITFADDGTALIATADKTFTNADVTLAAVFTAMEDASVTLASANKTFDLANRIIENDVEGVISDLSGAAKALTTTVNKAAENIDIVSEKVVAASTSAANLTASLEQVVRNNQRQLSDFLRLGLPSALRFTEEARSLVVNIERLVNRIERDPARFLLGTQNSRFDR
ncbi:MlaD family protein [uncultured Tateyamaria sp.]|uniref:MlaD family protein n=1 Tax=uncultured Tateyamaria sp. TaxID=455651 RepID=UPI002624D7EE|nr:MlaD family protein [uncultured Tateyamaria sp.]